MTPIWAKQMIGTAVRAPTGEVLGEINDFVFNSTLTYLEYVLLSSGDFLGMGGKLFPVPLQSLALDTENECFVLNIDSQRLRGGPNFDVDDGARINDPNYRDEVFRYYGIAADTPSIHAPGT